MGLFIGIVIAVIIFVIGGFITAWGSGSPKNDHPFFIIGGCLFVIIALLIIVAVKVGSM